MKHIASISNDIISDVVSRSSIIDVDVFLRWHDIIGQELSEITYPDSITENNEGEKVIVLKVSRYNLLEVKYKADLILQKLNSFFGKGSFSRIKFKPIL